PYPHARVDAVSHQTLAVRAETDRARIPSGPDEEWFHIRFPLPGDPCLDGINHQELSARGAKDGQPLPIRAVVQAVWLRRHGQGIADLFSRAPIPELHKTWL